MKYEKITAVAAVLAMCLTALAGISWGPGEVQEEIAKVCPRTPTILGVRDSHAATDYATLVQAITDATNGDTVTLAAGTYTASGSLTISKNLNFAGAGETTVTWTHGSNNLIVTGQCTFRNMTILGEYGISTNSGTMDIDLDNCTVNGTSSALSATSGVGYTGTMTNVKLHGQSADGMSIDTTLALTAYNLTAISAQCAISALGVMSGSLSFSNITGDYGLGVYGAGGLSFTNCSIVGATDGFWVVDGTSLAFVNTTVSGGINVQSGDVTLYGINSSIESAAGTTAEYWMPCYIIIDGVPSSPVWIQSAFGTNATNGTSTTDDFGRANFTNVLQGTLAETTFTNTTYTYRTPLPEGWSFDDVTVCSADRLVNATAALYGDEIIWFAMANNWVVSNRSMGADQGVALNFSDNNNTEVREISTTINSTNPLRVVNLGMNLNFHTFNLTIANWTSDEQEINMSSYTVHIYDHGTLVESVSTTNHSACWEGATPFGDQVELVLNFSVPEFVVAGNYTTNYWLQAWNDTLDSTNQTAQLTILPAAAVTLTTAIQIGTNAYNTVDSSPITFPAMQAGVTSWANATLAPMVKNSGNTNISQIEFAMSDFVNVADAEDTWNASSYLRIINTMPFSTQNKTLTAGSALFNFTPAVVPNSFRIFSAKLNSTPLGLDGTYNATLWARGNSSGGWSVWEPQNVTVTVNASFVSMTVGYWNETRASASPQQYFAWGQLAPSATECNSTNWIKITNVGNVAITTLNFTFSNLTNATEVKEIAVRGNAKLFNVTGASNDVTTAANGTVSLALNLAPNASVYYRLRLEAIPADAFACSYSSSYTIRATYTPGSRVGDEIIEEVVQWLGATGNTTGVGIISTDLDANVSFSNPIYVGKESGGSFIVRNNGITPINAFILLFNDSEPCVLGVYFDGTEISSTYRSPYADGYQLYVGLSTSLRTGEYVEVSFDVDSLAAGYSSGESYSVNVTFLAILALEGVPPEDAGTFQVEFNASVASVNVSAGLNYITVPTTDEAVSARDLTNQSGVVWVAAWVDGDWVFYTSMGTGTNFALYVGQGLAIMSSGAEFVAFGDSTPRIENVTLSAGLNFVGNPSATGFEIDNLTIPSNVTWIAMDDSGEFVYYVPTLGAVNFEVTEYAALWIQCDSECSMLLVPSEE